MPRTVPETATFARPGQTGYPLGQVERFLGAEAVETVGGGNPAVEQTIILRANQPMLVDLSRMVFAVTTTAASVAVIGGPPIYDLTQAASIRSLDLRGSVNLLRGNSQTAPLTLSGPASVFHPYRQRNPVNLGVVELDTNEELVVTFVVNATINGSFADTYAMLGAPCLLVSDVGSAYRTNRFKSDEQSCTFIASDFTVLAAPPGNVLSIQLNEDGDIDLSRLEYSNQYLQADSGFAGVPAVPNQYLDATMQNGVSSILLPDRTELIQGAVSGGGTGIVQVPAAAFGSSRYRSQTWCQLPVVSGNNQNTFAFTVQNGQSGPPPAAQLGAPFLPSRYRGQAYGRS